MLLAEVEQAADDLLRESVARVGRGEYPFYSPGWLRHLDQADGKVQDRAGGAADLDVQSLVEGCLRLVAQTPMRREYRQAVRLAVKGYTFKEIAERLGSSSSQARRWVKRAIGILAARVVDRDKLLSPDDAIRVAYRADVARLGYTGPRHCKVGQEECRGSGLCTRRWYLLDE